MFKLINNLRHNVSLNSTRSLSIATRSAATSPSTLLIHRQQSKSCICCNVNSSRSLFTDVALGMDKLDRLRERKGQLFFSQDKESYMERLRTYIQEGNKLIIKDDLISLIGIAESDQHLDLLDHVICGTQEDMRSFWGSTIMRLYYKMGKLDRAYANIKDVERFGEFFNQFNCYKIVMTMLYDAGRYKDVVEMYQFSENRMKTVENERVPLDLVTLTFASLAKINNVEALKIAESLHSKLEQNKTYRLGVRPASFLAYLQVNNEKPTEALNLISAVRGFTYLSLREMKIRSLIKLKRYDDILMCLREFVSFGGRDSAILLKSTVALIEQNDNKIDNENLRQELRDILVELKDGSHVSEATIEEVLFKPIDYLWTRESRTPQDPIRNQQDKRHNFGFRNYNNNNNYRYRGAEGKRDGESYSQRPRYNNQYRDQQQYGGEKKFSYQRMSLD